MKDIATDFMTPIIIIGLILFSVLLSFIYAEERHVEEKTADLRNQVVAIYRTIEAAERGTPNGTAFSIGNGYFLTNAHVTTGMEIFYISTFRGNFYVAQLKEENVKLDVAIFKVYGEFSDIEPATFECRDPVYAEEVRMIGNPSGYSFFTSFGRIAGDAFYDELNKNNNAFPVNATFAGGMSGGPVYDASGYVIGQVYALISTINSTNRRGILSLSPLNFGIITSATDICKYLNEINQEYIIQGKD
jgi:S1-C subfamily serine protease